MTVLVVRKALDGTPIGTPQRCAKPGRVVRVPGLPTIEEQIAIFLADGESVRDSGAFGRWQIVDGNEPAGFIEILDEHRGSESV